MDKSNKTKKKTNKKAILPIVLYGVAALIAIYSIFTMYSSYTYIASLVEMGSIDVSEQIVDVIGYYVNASLPYVFYAIAVWAIGYVINKVNQIQALLNPNTNETIVEKLD